MCGIFGSVGEISSSFDSNEKVLKLLELRGPDDNGQVNLKAATLGHTRLAIQDAEHGSQPMKSASGKNILVFNGEIYNHIELRRLMPDFNWKSLSDTETVVELLEAFGTQIIAQFTGMFAFGIWNIKESELILGRDGFGEKPLYYCWENNRLSFCSDPRGIPLLNQNEKNYDSTQFPYFLKYGYIKSSDSTYAQISMLKPGCTLKWKKSEIVVSQITNYRTRSKSEHLNTGILRSHLEKAVQNSLIADEKVGIMLSGGLDSSIIAAIASKHQTQLPTYTVALQKNSEDAKYSQLLAKLLKTDHNEIQIDPRTLAETIENLLGNIAQPFADTALIPTFILSKFASKDVKVLLSGDGADEVFAGYGYYEKYRKIGLKDTPRINSYFKQLRYLSSKNTRSKRINRNREEYRDSLLTSKRTSVDESWNHDLATFSDSELKKFSKISFDRINKGELPKNLNRDTFWNVIDADRDSYLAGDILRKSDMGGMLASVEIRSPYLDRDLNLYLNDCQIEPEEYTKRILYNSCADLIPKEIFNRKKQGFGAPLDLWLSYPEVEKLVSSLLNSSKAKVYEYFQFEEARKLVSKSNLKKWNFFALAIWLEKNAD